MATAAPENVPEWKLARRGMDLLINNRVREAEVFFKEHPESLRIFAAQTCGLFIDALMTFEEDRLSLAMSGLHELERRCTLDSGLLKSFKNRLSGSTRHVSYADELETRIMLADSQLCMSVLTFLQQDIAAYFKGGWTLRKAWRLYQQLYKEVVELYERTIGKLQLPEPMQSSSSSSLEVPGSDLTLGTTNGYYIRQRKLARSETADLAFGCGEASRIKKSISVNHSLSGHAERRRLSDSFSNGLSLAFDFFSSEKLKQEDVDGETVIRLMGAVSFGYGVFQLGISLLPPTLLKVSNLLGFSGNKERGVQCLMYSRLGCDMRAPLATLALLWYHTIIRPFYALDGRNVRAGVEISQRLLDESKKDYEESALFLFFSGRVHRLKSEIPEALNDFLSSAENTTHREIKMLSMHEVAWCYLILLDFPEAEVTFQYLKNASRWSRAFYAHLAVLCQGTCGNLNTVTPLKEIEELMKHGSRETQLQLFLNRRHNLYPTQDDDRRFQQISFWKLLLYEVLYLWNALPSCSFENAKRIISECRESDIVEPMLGISKLIEGSCLCNLGRHENGVLAFRQCLDQRKELPNNSEDAHVSAFAQYELGALLVRKDETKEEGKLLLQQISQYKDYDFEQRLSVRVHTMLKHL